MATATLTRAQQLANNQFKTDAENAIKAINMLMQLADQVDTTDTNWTRWMQKLLTIIPYLSDDVAMLQQAYNSNN